MGSGTFLGTVVSRKPNEEACERMLASPGGVEEPAPGSFQGVPQRTQQQNSGQDSLDPHVSISKRK